MIEKLAAQWFVHQWALARMDSQTPDTLEFVDRLVARAVATGRVSAAVSSSGSVLFEDGTGESTPFLSARLTLRRICARLGVMFGAPSLYGSANCESTVQIDGREVMLRLDFSNDNRAGVWFRIVTLQAPTGALSRDGTPPQGVDD